MAIPRRRTNQQSYVPQQSTLDPNRFNQGFFGGQGQVPANANAPGNIASSQLQTLTSPSAGNFSSLAGLVPNGSVMNVNSPNFLDSMPAGVTSTANAPESNNDVGGLFTKENFGIAANVAQGAGSLINAYTGFKQLGVAEDQLALQEEFARKNLANQTRLTNNRLRDQNAWKAAQGRTDFAKLV